MGSPLVRVPSGAAVVNEKENAKYFEGMGDPELTKGSNQKSVMAAALNATQAPYSVIKVELPHQDLDSLHGELSDIKNLDPRLESSVSPSMREGSSESRASYRERGLRDRYGVTSPTSSTESARHQHADHGALNDSKDLMSIPSWMYDPALGGFNPLPTRGALHNHMRRDIRTVSGRRNTTAKAVLQMKQAMDMIQNEVNFANRGAIAGWKLSPIKSYHQNRAYGLWSQARSETATAASSRPATQQSRRLRSRQSTRRSASADPSLDFIAKQAFGSPISEDASRRLFGGAGGLPFHSPSMSLSGTHDSLSQITAHANGQGRGSRGLAPLKRGLTEQSLPASSDSSLNTTLRSQASFVDGGPAWHERLAGSPARALPDPHPGASLPLPVHDYRDRAPSAPPAPVPTPAPVATPAGMGEPYLQYLKRRVTRKGEAGAGEGKAYTTSIRERLQQGVGPEESEVLE